MCLHRVVHVFGWLPVAAVWVVILTNWQTSQSSAVFGRRLVGSTRVEWNEKKKTTTDEKLGTEEARQQHRFLLIPPSKQKAP